MVNIYYIVTIKDEYVNYFDDTIITNKFCGRLFLTTEDKAFFKLYNKRDIQAEIIIPIDWILCMAPSCEHWSATEE